MNGAISIGKPSTSSTPITAVSPIALATSFFSAPITGASAAIAEFPQIEFPIATNAARCTPRPRARPTEKLTTMPAATPPNTSARRAGPAFRMSGM